jgi:PEP-CTERM motif
VQKFVKMAAAAAVAFIATSANAATINFDEFIGGQQTYTTVNSQGFNFVNSNPSSQALLIWAANSGANANPGGATLSNNFQNTTTTVTKIGGGIFTFNSIDLADVFNNGGGGDIQFNFNGAGGPSSQVVTIDNQPGLQTFSFNRAGLTSFSYNPLSTQGRWVQVDNIVVDNNVLGGVPEPTSWALMIAGFGLTGSAMRRRKTLVQVTYA